MTRLLTRPGSASFRAALLAGIISFPLPLHAFDKPRAYVPHDPPRVAADAADIIDVLRLDRPRPVWLRLHLLVDGAAFVGRPERAFDALFDFLDANSDGVLDAIEARHAPTEQQLRLIVSQGAFYPVASPPAPFSQLDADRDGRVTRGEFAQYLSKMNLPLVRLQPRVNPDVFAAALSRALFNALDRDGDGKLTRAEAAAAEALLDRYDLNDDEMLVGQELVGDLRAIGAFGRTPPDGSAYLVGIGMITPPGFAHRLLAAYDADKDFHLTVVEAGLDRAAMAALDRNGDGRLDVPELADWFRNGQPDVEAWLAADGDAPAARLRRGTVRPGLEAPGQRADGLRLRTAAGVLELGGSSLQFGNFLQARKRAVRQSMGAYFVQAAGAKGYVDRNDLAKTAGPMLQTLFDFGDRNGDGRLTREECAAYVDLQIRLADLPVGLTIMSEVIDLFTALDTDGDGRLSRRELRSAWTALAALQPAAESLVLPGEHAVTQLIVHRGPMLYVNVTQNGFTPPRVPPRTAGPLWFRKMDRNEDGFVSRREFLGNQADFDRLDADGDGLIDPEEAARLARKK